jgi:hypothetical protein
MVRTWLVVPLVGAVWMVGFWALGFLLGSAVYAFESEETRIRVFPLDLVARLQGPTPENTGGYLSFLSCRGARQERGPRPVTRRDR